MANPELLKHYRMIERGADLSKYPLLESDAYLSLPKVAQFREWIFSAARDFRAPEFKKARSAFSERD